MLYKPPTQNALQYTLDSQIAAGANSLTLNQSVTGIVQAPGILVIDRVDSSGNVTASKREYKSFTTVAGAVISGLSGGLAGSTDQVHSVGAIVEFVPDVLQQQAIYDAITLEHSVGGQHTSLASVGQLKAFDIIGLSTASLQLANVRALAVASLASIQQLFVTNLINASSASLVGVFPSGASGGVLTSNSPNGPVFAPPSAGGTGGFNAVFQVPGGLASLANIGGLIPVPVAFTAGFVQYFVQTPSSVASISVVLKKNLNTVFAVGGIAAGATFGSSASISNTALVAGDVLTMDINSNASLGADLSVLLRAT